MVKKPESIHFHKPTSQAIYYSMVTLIIAMLLLFAHILYLAYQVTIGAEFSFFHHIVLALVLVSIALFATLIIVGKIGYKELSDLRKYKYEIEY